MWLSLVVFGCRAGLHSEPSFPGPQLGRQRVLALDEARSPAEGPDDPFCWSDGALQALPVACGQKLLLILFDLVFSGASFTCTKRKVLTVWPVSSEGHEALRPVGRCSNKIMIN